MAEFTKIAPRQWEVAVSPQMAADGTHEAATRKLNKGCGYLLAGIFHQSYGDSYDQRIKVSVDTPGGGTQFRLTVNALGKDIPTTDTLNDHLRASLRILYTLLVGGVALVADAIDTDVRVEQSA